MPHTRVQEPMHGVAAPHITATPASRLSVSHGQQPPHARALPAAAVSPSHRAAHCDALRRHWAPFWAALGRAHHVLHFLVRPIRQQRLRHGQVAFNYRMVQRSVAELRRTVEGERTGDTTSARENHIVLSHRGARRCPLGGCPSGACPLRGMRTRSLQFSSVGSSPKSLTSAARSPSSAASITSSTVACALTTRWPGEHVGACGPAPRRPGTGRRERLTWPHRLWSPEAWARLPTSPSPAAGSGQLPRRHRGQAYNALLPPRGAQLSRGSSVSLCMARTGIFRSWEAGNQADVDCSGLSARSRRNAVLA